MVYIDSFCEAFGLGDEGKRLDDDVNDVAFQVREGRRVAVITSGSVLVPLDDKMLSFKDTLGTGNRGAAVAEELLRRKYAVVFLHREGSVLPFTRVLSKLIKKRKSLHQYVTYCSPSRKMSS